MRNRELANLNTLRTFAVLSVLVNHAAITLNSLYIHSPVLLEFVMRLGRMGVIAFFVHTSLVLMFSLERIYKESPRPNIAFYLRRVFRIYPLSILVVILVALLQIPDQPFSHSLPGRYSPLNILSNLLLFQNFVGFTITGPLWSLPFEIQMYMVLPVLYLLVRRRGSTRMLAGLIGCFAALGVACYVLIGKQHFLAFIPCFLSGIMAYSLRDRQRPTVKAVYWSLYVPLLLLVFSATGVVWPKAEYIWGWILSCFLGGSVYVFHDSTNQTWNKITQNIAKYSYGLYLLHIPALWLVFKVMGITGPVTGTLTWLAIVAVGSLIAFHAIEDPMIQYGKGFTRMVVARLQARKLKPARKMPAFTALPRTGFASNDLNQAGDQALAKQSRELA